MSPDRDRKDACPSAPPPPSVRLSCSSCARRTGTEELSCVQLQLGRPSVIESENRKKELLQVQPTRTTAAIAGKIGRGIYFPLLSLSALSFLLSLLLLSRWFQCPLPTLGASTSSTSSHSPPSHPSALPSVRSFTAAVLE